jgi:hypothetical protein
MVLEGGTIVPQLPLEPYNPFQPFKPYGVANRGDFRSVVYELSEINPESLQAILNFCDLAQVIR